MKVCIITRSCSGSGKSTFGKFLQSLYSEAVICEADSYFTDENGNYNFDAKKLGLAHNKCKEKFVGAIYEGKELIIISNTSTKEIEFSYYKETAEKNGYLTFFIVLEKRHNNFNSHNVPDFTIQKQADLIKNSLKLF